MRQIPKKYIASTNVANYDKLAKNLAREMQDNAWRQKYRKLVITRMFPKDEKSKYYLEFE